jgi:hypothetical protein
LILLFYNSFIFFQLGLGLKLLDGPAKHISLTLTVPTLFVNQMFLVYPMLVNTFVEAKDHHAQDPKHEQKTQNIPFHFSKLDFVLKCMLCISVKRKINDQLHLETRLKLI